MDLDFNIDRYSDEELLQLFNNVGIEENINLLMPHTEKELYTCKSTLMDKLIIPTNKSEKNNEITLFLNNATNRLINKINNYDINLDLINKKDLNPNDFLKDLGNTVDNGPNIPGIINPLKIRSMNKIINIDTKFRSNYYNSNASDFQFSLPLNLTKVISMNVHSYQIPLTYYAISKNKNNNSFIIKNVVGSTASGPFTITIPDGNYGTEFNNIGLAANLEKTINNAMLSSGLLATELVFSIDKNTGKSIISSPIGSSVKGFEVDFNILNDGSSDKSNSLPLHLGWLLGFRTGNYIGGGSPGAIVSEGICLVKSPTYIYICIDDFTNNSNNNFINAFNESMLNKNVLAKVNVNNLEQTNGIYQYGNDNNINLLSKRNYFGPVTINKFKISLIDEFGRIVDLNNMDWSLSLLFECIYNE